MKPCIVDIYHRDVIEGQDDGTYSGFATMKAAGYLAVIHKASQGSADPLYAIRRPRAIAAGLLWGAYHFNTSEDVKIQLDRFFDAAKPDANTRMCLDFEAITDEHQNPLPEDQQMSLAQAVEFLDLGSRRLGRKLTLYSGGRIKDTIVDADAATRAMLAKFPFWLCEYGPTAKLVDAAHEPLPWQTWNLWQRDADGIGPDEHDVPGMLTPGIDQSLYAGTPAQLAAEWAGAVLQVAA